MTTHFAVLINGTSASKNKINEWVVSLCHHDGQRGPQQACADNGPLPGETAGPVPALGRKPNHDCSQPKTTKIVRRIKKASDQGRSRMRSSNSKKALHECKRGGQVIRSEENPG